MKTEIQHTHRCEITLDDVRNKIVTIRNKAVLLDSDVARLYGVETREVNQAIKNNPGKFPEGYVVQLDKDEWEPLRSKFLTFEHKGAVKIFDHSQNELIKNCDTSQNLKSKILTSSWGGKNKLPKAFTEKGLYMLATILKSEKATDTTLAIVEAFAKIRELSGVVADLVKSPGDTQKQAAVMQKSSEMLSDMVSKELQTTGTETSFEINLFSAVKIKHTIKKERKRS